LSAADFAEQNREGKLRVAQHELLLRCESIVVPLHPVGVADDGGVDQIDRFIEVDHSQAAAPVPFGLDARRQGHAIPDFQLSIGVEDMGGFLEGDTMGLIVLADESDTGSCEKEAGKESDVTRGRKAEIGTQHVEGCMREIQHAHHAENERQA